MLNMMMMFADAERKMIRSRVQEGIDGAIAEGKRVGRPPLKMAFCSKSRANTSARRISSGRFERAVKSDLLQDFSRYHCQKCAASSNGQKKTTTSRSITINGGLNALKSKLGRKSSNRLLNRTLNRSILHTHVRVPLFEMNIIRLITIRPPSHQLHGDSVQSATDRCC